MSQADMLERLFKGLLILIQSDDIDAVVILLNALTRNEKSAPRQENA